MKWHKRGLVWTAAQHHPLAISHGMGPTPILKDSETIRVYLTCLDATGRGRPFFVDVSAANPCTVVGVSDAPLLDIGRPGTFDDNGLMLLSIVPTGDHRVLMYYAGFELCRSIRYRIFTGIAVSSDNGETFQRHSEAPVLDRRPGELFFRCGPYVLYEDGRYRMWYVAGDEWTDVGGKEMPVYHLRYLESSDGLRWEGESMESMAISNASEHGFGRPWVRRSIAGEYELYFSVRRRDFGAYRLGFARSKDGLKWTRADDELGLDVSPAGFDSTAIMYSAVITVGERTYCFYNGNEFGREGFAVAELLP